MSGHTISEALRGVNVGYESLQDQLHGKYNAGEVTLKQGIFGGYSFSKVNNHVGALSGYNTVVTSRDQNRKVRLAAFKTLYAKFGGDDFETRFGELTMGKIMKLAKGGIGGEGITRLFEGVNNDYLKVAFFALLADSFGEAISRDELTMIDTLLQQKHDQGDMMVSDEELMAKRDTLQQLHALKRANIVAPAAGQQPAAADRNDPLQWVRALHVANPDTDKQQRAYKATVNSLGEQMALMAEFSQKLADRFAENVLKAPTLGEVFSAKEMDNWLDTLADGMADEIVRFENSVERADNGAVPTYLQLGGDVQTIAGLFVKSLRQRGKLPAECDFLRISEPVKERAKSVIKDIPRSRDYGFEERVPDDVRKTLAKSWLKSALTARLSIVLEHFDPDPRTEREREESAVAFDRFVADAVVADPERYDQLAEKLQNVVGHKLHRT